MSEDSIVILVVEDNPGDVLLLTEAIEQAGAEVQVHVVRDGEEATDFLGRRGPYVDAPRPDLILLDLNLPVKSGREVLAELVAEPTLNGIPVTVLTSSKTEYDICDKYTQGRCLYFVKTGDIGELVRIVRRIVDFALSVRGGHD